MKAFGALVWKEWRDARWTLAVAFAAVAPLSFAFHAFLPRWLHGEWTAVFALAAMPALFALVLAGDLVAGDARGGRLASLRALPCSPIAAFGAKLAWLAIACAAFVTWCFAVQLPVLAWFDVEGARLGYLNALERTAPLALLGLALGAGALFASSLAVGGLKAMLVSLLIVGVPLALGVEVAHEAALPITSDHLGSYALAFTAAAVLAAAASFCHGRLHLGARWRPALVGWSALALCALPSSGYAAWRTARWLSLGPDSTRLVPESLYVSPDGRYVAVQVADPSTVGRGARNVGRREIRTPWIVEIENGGLQVVPGRNWRAHRWSDAGQLLLTRQADDGHEAWEDARALDPETLEIGGERVDPREVSEPWHTYPAWARTASPGEEGEPLRVFWDAAGISESFEARRQAVRPQHVPGVVLHYTDDGGLERVDLGVGRATLVERGVRPHPGWDRLSFDDRYVLVELEEGDVVLDAHSGARVAGPWPETWVRWLFDGPAGRFVLRMHRQRSYRSDAGARCSLVDLETGTEVELGRSERPYDGIRRLPDGRFVVLRPDGVVELLAADGSLLRVLVSKLERAS